MTDIRKHGFESDQQWREYLAEIEETATATEPVETDRRMLMQELGDLRAEVDRLRERVRAHVRNRRESRRWRAVGAGAVLLLLTAVATQVR